MPCYARQRPSITPRLAKPRQERVTEAVQNEWTNGSQTHSLPVLLLKAGRFDMPNSRSAQAISSLLAASP